MTLERLVTLTTCLALAWSGAGAQAPVLTERLSAASDTAMHYALLAPPDSGRPRPVLIVMDPRGRAVRSLALFRAAADSLGWIVISSYETASDDPNAPNVRAVNAIVRDLETRWNADMRRLYIAGFSGTARLAWDFATQMRGHVAGIIAAGAGLTGFSELVQTLSAVDSTFAYATSAGVVDYNWIEVRETELLLRARRLPQRAWYHPGGHAWPPQDVATEMVMWLDAESQRTAWRDSLRMRARAARQLGIADSLAASGRSIDALAIYEDAARQFAGTPFARGAEAQRKRLEESKVVQRYRQAESKEIAGARDGAAQANATLVSVRATRGLTERDLASRLRIDHLLERSRSRDSLAAGYARRRLEHLFVQVAALDAREYVASGDTVRARLLLKVAAAIDSTRARAIANNLGVRF